jgi:DNA-binding MarR family transcriptional regulator
MAQRNRITKRLFSIIKQAKNDPDAMIELLRTLAFEEMEAKQRAVYLYCWTRNSRYYERTQAERIQHHYFKGPPVQEPPPRFTSAEIAKAFDIQTNHAGMTLKEFYDMGLMKRERLITDEGREYAYWLA